MKLDPTKFALSAAMTIAILWVIISLLILSLPDTSLKALAAMTHSDFESIQWSLNLVGFIVGLILWVIVAGVIAWLVATFYNRQL